jgi:hypothetical protein
VTDLVTRAIRSDPALAILVVGVAVIAVLDPWAAVGAVVVVVGTALVAIALAVGAAAVTFVFDAGRQSRRVGGP